MKAKQVIRNIQIYYLTGLELDKRSLSLYNELKEIFDNLEIYVYGENWLYFLKNDKVYIRYKSKTKGITLDSKLVTLPFDKNRYLDSGEDSELLLYYIAYKFGFNLPEWITTLNMNKNTRSYQYVKSILKPL